MSIKDLLLISKSTNLPDTDKNVNKFSKIIPAGFLFVK